MKKLIGKIIIIAFVGSSLFGVLPYDVQATSNERFEEFNGNDGIIEGNVLENKINSRAITEGRYDGGYWVRGITFGATSYVISRYKSDRSQGHASVVNGQGLYHAGGWKSRGTFSSAERWATWTGNKSYYDWK